MRSILFLCALPAVLLAAVPANAAEEALFSSEPHVLAFETRQQVVLFAGAGVTGGMATRRGDGSFDVLVPGAGVDAAIEGREFVGPAVDVEGRGTAVSLQNLDGDVRIRIQARGDVARVVAYAVSDPARLMIDLLPAGTAVEEVHSGKTRSRRRADDDESAVVRPTAGRSGLEAPPEPADASGAGEAKTPDSPSLGSNPVEVATGEPAQATTTEPEDGPSEAAPETDRVEPVPAKAPQRWEDVVAGLEAELSGPACPAPAADAIPADSGVEVGQSAPDEDRALVADAAAAWARDPAAQEAHCRFMRVAGAPFCAPNPDSPYYRENVYVSGLTHRIAAGATWLAPLQMAPDDPVGLYLQGDRDFILNANDGWLLAAVRSYARALRLAPHFGDAVRARMNIALIYSRLEFVPELESRASDATNPAREFARVLLGDVRRGRGDLAGAAELYASAATAGGLPACLAARGLAYLALAEGRVERARTGVLGLNELCSRSVLIDSDTARLRARVDIASGDADGALATLSSASSKASRWETGGILRERAQIAESAGRLLEARHAWEELQSGSHGEDLAVEAAIALARLEGTSESIEEGLARIEELPSVDRSRARAELLAEVSDGALADGDGLPALSMILAEGFDPSGLDVSSRVGLAATYRQLGLLEKSIDTLDRIEASSQDGLPPSYWEERANVALVEDDPAAAELALARWRRSLGGNPSARALAVQARILSRRKAPVSEIEPLLARLAGLEKSRALSMRWEVAREFADRDPASGLALLGGDDGLKTLPDLDEAELTETLWRLGRAAESRGDAEAALTSYQALAHGLPGTPRGAEASYRAGRLHERRDAPGEARRAYDRASTHPEELDRRQANATSAYHEVVRLWTRRQGEP